MKDRYLKVILTVIAVELLWLGVKDLGTPVSAQANGGPIPVIIRRIQIENANVRFQSALPFYQVEPMLVTATAGQPVTVQAVRPIPITAGGPLKIEADKPLPVENVGYTPGLKPGE
jgi:hypothetical protein